MIITLNIDIINIVMLYFYNISHITIATCIHSYIASYSVAIPKLYCIARAI